MKKFFEDTIDNQQSINEDYELIQQWKEKQDPVALQKLIKRHYRLIYKISQMYKKKYCDMQDLVSEGIVGFITCLDSFDSTKKTTLSSYAYYYIRYKIQNFIKKVKTTSQQGKANISADHVNEQGDKYENLLVFQEKSASEKESTDEISRLLKISIEYLNKTERYVLEQRFFSTEKKTFVEISEVLNLSKERVRQIEFNAIQKLKKRMVELGVSVLGYIVVFYMLFSCW